MGFADFRAATAAEWIKLWTLRSSRWLLVGSVLMMALVSLMSANDQVFGVVEEESIRVGDIAVQSAMLVQFVIAAFAILVVTGEYSSRSIQPSLQAVPRRGRLLLAKSTAVVGVVFPLGLVLGSVGVAVAAPVLGKYGDVAIGAVIGQVLAIAIHLTLVSLLAVGVAFTLRSALGGFAVCLAPLALVPYDFMPGAAGMDFMRLDGLIGPGDWSVPLGAVAVVAAWAAAAWLVGYRLLRHRDA